MTTTKKSSFKLIACTHDLHAASILEILNDSVVNSTALYDYEPRKLESMTGWFASKNSGNFPVVGAVADGTEAGKENLMGFATYGRFRGDWPAYQYSVEHSVYVHPHHRGKGVAKALMTELIAIATKQQYHTMIGGIDAENAGSIALHTKLGFKHAGTLQHVGYKFDRWLDLSFYQLMLEVTSKDQIDGALKN